MKFLNSQLQKLKKKADFFPQEKFQFKDFLKLIKEPILYEISEHKLQMIFDLLKDDNGLINRDQYEEICEMCFEQILEDLDDDKMDFDKAIKIIENFKCMIAESNLQNSQKIKKQFLYNFFLQGEYEQKVYCIVLLHQSFANSFQFGEIKKQLSIWEEDVLYNNKYFRVKHIDLQNHRDSNKSTQQQNLDNLLSQQNLMVSIQNILVEKNIDLNLNDQEKLQQDIEKLYVEKECSPQCLQNKIEIQQDLNYYKNLLDTQDNKILNYEKRHAEKDQIISQYSLEIIELKKKFKQEIQNQLLSQKNLSTDLEDKQQKNINLLNDPEYLNLKNQLQLQLNKNRDLLEQIQELNQIISETQVENVQLNSEKQQFLSQVQPEPTRQRTQSITTLQNLLLKTQENLDNVNEKYNQRDKENVILKKRIKENEDLILNMQQKLVDQLMKQSEQDPHQIQIQLETQYQTQFKELNNKIKTQAETIKVLENKLERIKTQNETQQTTSNNLQVPNQEDQIHLPKISLKKNTFLQKLEENYKINNVSQEQKQLEDNLNEQLSSKKKKKIRQKVTKILGLPNEQKLDTRKYSYDYLDINNNKQILTLIRNFQPFKKNTKCFSSMIQRVNSWNKKTKKWLVITNKYIYMFTPPNKIKNIININEINCVKHSKVNNYVGIQHIKLEDEIFEIFKKTEFLLYLRKKILRKKQQFLLKEEQSFNKYSRMNNKNKFIPEDFDSLKPNFNKTFLDASNNGDIYNVKIPVKNFLSIEYETEALMMIMNYGLIFFDPQDYYYIDFYPMIGIFLSRSVFSEKQISLLFCNNDQKFINFLSKKERENCYQKFILKFIEKKQEKK